MCLYFENFVKSAIMETISISSGRDTLFSAIISENFLQLANLGVEESPGFTGQDAG